MKEIPQEVLRVMEELGRKGFEAYVVGGCVRDLLLGKEPEDWDIATNAAPEEVQKIFPRTFYKNKFFTVTVLTESLDPKLGQIEVTAFRSEFEYEDRRRPSKVEPAKTIEEDLSRRDFTINAIALRPGTGKPSLADPYDGQKDLKKKIVRCVGNPKERFEEDALRLMRAVRFAATLGFSIEQETLEALRSHAHLLKDISKERIRDEFSKIRMADRAQEGIEQLRETTLLQHIIPELLEGYGVIQNKHHIYTVWEHQVRSLAYAAKQKWSLEVRLASLLHDVAKPRAKRGEGLDSTFYNHDAIGGRMTDDILTRLKFSRNTTDYVAMLVRYHMFYYNVGEVSESSVRRLLRKVGPEHMEDLLKVRMADRIGSGVPKAEPYKLRHLRYAIEKVSKDPLSPKMLALKGNDIMDILKIAPGPKIGQILAVVLAEVLEDPARNSRETLEVRVRELGKLDDTALSRLAKESQRAVEKVATKMDDMVKQKYWVT
ncbi:MAG: HD domain-containing protein [Parcubacteria group bacterium]|nr:HD domain-containing protein [Parcubacteria group bacterium]